MYNAHGKRLPLVEVLEYWHDIQRRPLLRARGVSVGTIDQCSARIGNAIVTANCLDILRIFAATPTNVAALQPESLWRVLCADRYARSHPDGKFAEAKLESLWTELQHSPINGHCGSTTASFAFDIEEYLGSGTSGSSGTELTPCIREYLELVRDTVWNRRTFRGYRAGNMRESLFGLVPRQARVGDSLCVLLGCSVPVCLRKVREENNGSRWQLIGEAYVHGFMDGEAISGEAILGGQSDEFDIV
ncbi:hypothetical protein DE146DRAFT_226946 [Phaeosphaeria sp. MPI-PUGE-AT-0046c]|nr:hypothetical protein DE146DRAFT_226946 [Phaeosphaeria sp. MPI-PUGE-AT-0046c]